MKRILPGSPGDTVHNVHSPGCSQEVPCPRGRPGTLPRFREPRSPARSHRRARGPPCPAAASLGVQGAAAGRTGRRARGPPASACGVAWRAAARPLRSLPPSCPIGGGEPRRRPPRARRGAAPAHCRRRGPARAPPRGCPPPELPFHRRRPRISARALRALPRPARAGRQRGLGQGRAEAGGGRAPARRTAPARRAAPSALALRPWARAGGICARCPAPPRRGGALLPLSSHAPVRRRLFPPAAVPRALAVVA